MEPGLSTDNLKVSTADGRNFVLLEEFSYRANSGEVITVPVGATSDGASTPPEIWPTIPPFGRYWKAAFLHDYLYRCTQRPKAECDGLFKEAMVSLGVNGIEADIIYAGVDLLGQRSFDADRAAQTTP
jgi:hypothetical protein